MTSRYRKFSVQTVFELFFKVKGRENSALRGLRSDPSSGPEKIWMTIRYSV